MYVDCDSGTVGFGSDVEYWGAPLNIPREHFPVYPMIGCCCPDATIKMIYRGSGKLYCGVIMSKQQSGAGGGGVRGSLIQTGLFSHS